MRLGSFYSTEGGGFMGKKLTVEAVTYVAGLIKHEASIISGGGVQEEPSWVSESSSKMPGAF
jgi:hypothetical protein